MGCRVDRVRRITPPSGDYGSSRYRVRLPPARKRNPPPALLGCSLSAAEREGRPLFRNRRQEQGLLGDEAAQLGEDYRAHFFAKGRRKGGAPGIRRGRRVQI